MFESPFERFLNYPNEALQTWHGWLCSDLCQQASLRGGARTNTPGEIRCESPLRGGA